jgi:hypothetical protein
MYILEKYEGTFCFGSKQMNICIKIIPKLAMILTASE